MNNDIFFMKKALRLARRAQGFTSPNPLVGAVIVKRGIIIASGYHKKAGLPHAEIEAIHRAKDKLKGSTLYVNLEPCCNFGRSGPCVDEIISQDIRRVVTAAADPNPKVNGKSIKKMLKSGINVKVGVCEKEAKALNEIFFTVMQKKRPFVAAKTAQSLDGKTATRKGFSKWITSERSRDFSKSFRDIYDCILVGINTVLADNPRLNGKKKIPFKAVIDSSLQIPVSSQLVSKYSDKLIVITSSRNRKKASKFPKDIVFIFMGESKEFKPKDIIKKIYELGITSVFIEGGSETLGRFFDARLVDKAYFFIAPKIIGGKNALGSVGAKGNPNIASCPVLDKLKAVNIGEDILVTGYPVYKKNEGI
ncbi:MAG: bifunctional diaminohydroxyphosphoribosylaminopyrimidine deaminase/5-amino-6-(5-phosphoribosylamino)uracil reductase RibD [Candidatus Omnitrophota bacterium]